MAGCSELHGIFLSMYIMRLELTHEMSLIMQDADSVQSSVHIYIINVALYMILIRKMQTNVEKKEKDAKMT